MNACDQGYRRFRLVKRSSGPEGSGHVSTQAMVAATTWIWCGKSGRAAVRVWRRVRTSAARARSSRPEAADHADRRCSRTADPMSSSRNSWRTPSARADHCGRCQARGRVVITDGKPAALRLLRRQAGNLLRRFSHHVDTEGLMGERTEDILAVRARRPDGSRGRRHTTPSDRRSRALGSCGGGNGALNRRIDTRP